MNNIKEFIEDAIKGGYPDHAYCNEFDMYESGSSYCHATVLLDPLAWQAVGNTRGWNKHPEWDEQQHRFVFHLQNGLDIETALSKIR